MTYTSEMAIAEGAPAVETADLAAANTAMLIGALFAAPAGDLYDGWYVAPGYDAGAFLAAVDEHAVRIGGAR